MIPKYRVFVELDNGCGEDDPAFYKEKLMFDVANLGFDESGLVEIMINDDYFRDGDSVYLDPEEVELLQFTGLKDRNDVEIYEGDIIQSGDHKELKLIGHRGYVIFEDGAFTLERRKHKVPYNYDKYIPYLDWPSEAFELCKVIGNRFENPEFLKEE